MNTYSDIEIKTAENLLKEGYKWIARNGSGRLSAHAAKPSKVNTYWWSVGKSDCTCDYVPIFQSIHFGDKEPTSLEAIVHPQILDDAEKRYLRAVIKPFRDRIKYIGKGFVDDWVDYARCYIYIVCTDANDDMTFPAFREIDMYKGMEINRKYTLKELGL